MEGIIREFRKVAPYIADRVKGLVSDSMDEASVMAVIHAEIVNHFANQQRMMMEYLTFTDDQRATFAAAMYDALLPAAESVKPTLNPLYEAYVLRTGKTGALNYLVNA